MKGKFRAPVSCSQLPTLPDLDGRAPQLGLGRCKVLSPWWEYSKSLGYLSSRLPAGQLSSPYLAFCLSCTSQYILSKWAKIMSQVAFKFTNAMSADNFLFLCCSRVLFCNHLSGNNLSTDRNREVCRSLCVI